ncbi:MAG: 1,4-dihydroxy-2-naphthoate polyprenyltransferase [Polyangiaceae bacterium]|nr:1,4-dihydroxy-2-naphthoate polyprenyltransferase [Polyangiaceae bacterium]MCL4748721.1 1,4-dihydroxy-2-naphthoate polyprenyltransferase [Myxococcales bacterium]
MTSTLSLPGPGSFGAWLLAARPQTLPVALAPVAVGTAVASTLGPVRWGAALAALAGALLIQIGTNFANDVFDHEKGADTAARLGPTRAVQSGILSAKAVKAGMIAAFFAAFLAGLYLTAIGGAPVVVIGIASILSGIAYTGGPYPLGYHGLGDLFVLVFFGFVAVCGTSFVAAGSVPALAWLAAVPVGALATAVLVVNNARDHQTDVGAGKRTLVVRFGRRFANHEYLALLSAAYLGPALMLGAGLGRPLVLAPWLTLPWAVRLWLRLRASEGRELNSLLPATARLLLAVSALLAIGIALS